MKSFIVREESNDAPKRELKKYYEKRQRSYQLEKPKLKKKKSKKIITNKPVDIDASIDSFTDEYNKLRKLVGADAKDYQNDKSAIAIYRANLDMIIELLPIARAAYKKSPNNFNASAVRNMVETARQLLQDIRNVQDIEQQVNHIYTEIIKPSIVDSTQFLIVEIFRLKKEIANTVAKQSSRKRLHRDCDNVLKNYGSHVSNIISELHRKLHSYMVE